jgi:phosphatidylglycerophosphate synthase
MEAIVKYLHRPAVKYSLFRDTIEEKHVFPILRKFVPPWIKSNHLSYLRMALPIPINYYLFFEPIIVLAIGIYAFACFTDYLDGALARCRRETSVFGERIDGLADKVLNGSIFACYSWNIDPSYSNLKIWMVANVIIDFFTTAGAIFALATKKNKTVPSNVYGKLKFNLQCVGIVLVTFSSIGKAEDVLFVAFALGVLSLICYIIAGCRKNSEVYV